MMRDKLATAQANLRTAARQIAGHKETIARLEGEVAEGAARVAALAARVLELETHPVVVPRERERLPDTRMSVAWDLRVGGSDVGLAMTVHVGLYPDLRVGELWIDWKTSRVHETQIPSFADLACTMASMLLQYGCPLKDDDATGETGVLSKMIYASDNSGGPTYWRLDPDGEYVRDPQVPMCASLRDYLAKKLAINTDAAGRWNGHAWRHLRAALDAARSADGPH